MYKLEQPLAGVLRKKVLLIFENMREDEWYIDDDKNILQQIKSFSKLDY